jgi:hypothetical protein
MTDTPINKSQDFSVKSLANGWTAILGWILNT